MIISRSERLNNDLALAIYRLRNLVDTDARTAEARAEARQLRSQAADTGVCPYCNTPTTAWSQRHRDACTQCGPRLDRMLMTKSKVKAGTYAVDMLTRYRDDYTQLAYVPYCLGGSKDRADQIVQAIDDLLVADAAMRRFKLEVQQQEARAEIQQRRLDSIRQDLVKLGASADEPGFDERVQEIYYSRYKDF